MLKRLDLSTLTTVFRIDPDVLAGVTASMRERGIDEATPIVAWNATVVKGHSVHAESLKGHHP